MIERKLLAALTLALMACGGGDTAETAESADATPAPAAEAAQAAEGGTGTVHEVRMLLTDGGQYVYEPDELTIRVGDTVRWINVSGGPHNVQFIEDSIPAGASDVLGAAMANVMGPLNGPFLMQPNETYEISFADAPTGEYYYVCTPHAPLGMDATLTIQ